MNHIIIRYSYLSAKADVTMNGEKASTYSDLSTTLNRPFLEAFERIIPALELLSSINYWKELLENLSFVKESVSMKLSR